MRYHIFVLLAAASTAAITEEAVEAAVPAGEGEFSVLCEAIVETHGIATVLAHADEKGWDDIKVQITGAAEDAELTEGLKEYLHTNW